MPAVKDQFGLPPGSPSLGGAATCLTSATAGGEVVRLAPPDSRRLPLVEAAPDASAFHQVPWLVLTAAYRFPAQVLAVVAPGGEVIAGLPLVRIRRPFSGVTYVSLPFTDHCPPLARDEDAPLLLAQGLEHRRRSTTFPTTRSPTSRQETQRSWRRRSTVSSELPTSQRGRAGARRRWRERSPGMWCAASTSAPGALASERRKQRRPRPAWARSHRELRATAPHCSRRRRLRRTVAADRSPSSTWVWPALAIPLTAGMSRGSVVPRFSSPWLQSAGASG